jgi:hypothetical protein
MQKGYNKYFSRIQWSPETSVCLIAFCTNEKLNPNTFKFFYYSKRQTETFLILNTEGTRKSIEDKRNFVISFIKHYTTVISDNWTAITSV